MTDKNLPSIEYLHKRLRYEPETGKLFWRDCEEIHGRGRALPTETFTLICRKGYHVGSLNGRHLKAHRVAWALYNGEWPSGQIDHINGHRRDNRICNLRSVTNLENCRNMSMKTSNKSGVTGVHWQKRLKKWQATITILGMRKHLGFFDALNDAANARSVALSEYGFSPRHGMRIEE
jgi:hypothetical protein